MDLKEVTYEKRKFDGEFDDTTKVLIEIMNNLSAQARSHWSFCGGFARDAWLKKPWNDYDLCSFATQFVQAEMEEMGILMVVEREGDEIPHDYFINPYDFNKREFPVHWIHADDQWAYAPKHFDFSINQICLKPDGYFYAPTYTWKDLDRKVIRRAGNSMTTNVVMRAIRFAAKYEFELHEDLKSDILSKVDTDDFDTLALKRNAQKMIEDGVASESLAMMKEFKITGSTISSSLEEFMSYQDRVVTSGRGRRERGGRIYDR